MQRGILLRITFLLGTTRIAIDSTEGVALFITQVICTFAVLMIPARFLHRSFDSVPPSSAQLYWIPRLTIELLITSFRAQVVPMLCQPIPDDSTGAEEGRANGDPGKHASQGKGKGKRKRKPRHRNRYPKRKRQEVDNGNRAALGGEGVAATAAAVAGQSQNRVWDARWAFSLSLCVCLSCSLSYRQVLCPPSPILFFSACSMWCLFAHRYAMI